MAGKATATVNAQNAGKPSTYGTPLPKGRGH